MHCIHVLHKQMTFLKHKDIAVCFVGCPAQKAPTPKAHYVLLRVEKGKCEMDFWATSLSSLSASTTPQQKEKKKKVGMIWHGTQCYFMFALINFISFIN